MTFGKFLVWSEYYNQFGIDEPFRVSVLEPRQSNFNPGLFSETCQTSKMMCFAEIING